MQKLQTTENHKNEHHTIIRTVGLHT